MKPLSVEMACFLGIQNKIQDISSSTFFVLDNSDCFLCFARSYLVSLFLLIPKIVQIKEQGIEEFFSSKIFHNHSLFDYNMVLVSVISTLFFDGSTA